MDSAPGQVVSAAAAAASAAADESTMQPEANNNTAAEDSLQRQLIKMASNKQQQHQQVGGELNEQQTTKIQVVQQEQSSTLPTDDISSSGANHTIIECGPSSGGNNLQQLHGSPESSSVAPNQQQQQSMLADSAATSERDSLETGGNREKQPNDSNKSKLPQLVDEDLKQIQESVSSTVNKEEIDLGQTLITVSGPPSQQHPLQKLQASNKSISNNKPKLIKSTNQVVATNQQHDHQHQNTTSDLEQHPYCKSRRLSYLQSLLLRKWPCLALAICIMSSLLFGMLLSALTVYMMHGVTDCSAALAHLSAGRLSSSGALAPAAALAPAIEPRSRSDFETPLELASLETSSSGRHFAALSAPPTVAIATSGDSQQQVQKQASAGNQKPRFQRLPESLQPEHYDLFVQPYIAEPFNFSGKVSIKILCKEPTNKITLHANDLTIDETRLTLDYASSNSSRKGTPVPQVTGMSQDKQMQYIIVQLDRDLEIGQEYALGIDFTGTLNDDLAGFYKIRYERPNSTETTWIAATQFQATDARRAFPCFDEPSYKATFSIQIKHWKNMTALSNMPIIDRQDSQDGLWVTDTFSKSQRMSTYLVAYAVTNFESRSEGNISVWTRPGFAHTAEYALKIAGKILRHYEDFFGIEYPLPKMDMIALPDFNAGAMENWGLITYRETAMLYDEASSSIANKQRVAVVVAHELAHQWFGNLVTPKWWDDLWLNEGFASYVEYIGVDFVEPQWRMLDQFVVEEVQNVLKMDALSSSHQISIPVNNPDEISEIFDHISYAKGASIIRMMNHFLTEKVFKAGLRRYLRALKYNNAEQSDLWAHLTEAASKGNQTVDVERVMSSWTLQTGFPLVSLTRQYGGKLKGAKLEQVRYQPYKSNQTANNSSVRSANTSIGLASSTPSQRWEIPITFTWKSEQNWAPNTRIWMHQNDTTAVELSPSQVPKSDDEWMLLNVNQVGYYRVNYDQRNWKLLIDQLQEDHKQISTINRAQILDDLFELARSGVLNYKSAMEATKYLRIERDYLPWDTVLMSLSYIDDMLQRTPIYGDWKDYISDLIRAYYSRYREAAWTKSTDVVNATEMGKTDVLEHYNMVNAIAWACQVEDHCIQKARSIFAEWRQSGRNEINPALRYTTYCTAIENGNKNDWDFLWKAYEKEQNASERDRILRALGCTKEIWILSRYLEWTFSKTKQIRRQDGAFVFRMIAKNNYGRDIAFNFLRERWSTIKEFYGKTSFSMGNFVRSIATSMNTQVELNQLTTFYEGIKNDVGTGKRSFQIAIEEVETNVLWRNRNYKIIEEWIQSNKGKSIPSAS